MDLEGNSEKAAEMQTTSIINNMHLLVQCLAHLHQQNHAYLLGKEVKDMLHTLLRFHYLQMLFQSLLLPLRLVHY